MTERNESEQLIDDLLDGDISEADFLRLEAELIVSKETRQSYYDAQKLHTALEIESESAGEGVPGRLPGKSGSPKRKLDGLMIGALAALLLLVAVLGWQIFQDSRNARDSGVEPVATGFGVVAGLAEAKWSDVLPPARGQLLPTGPLELESGIVQVELFSGALLVIEGPATFEVSSPLRVDVAEGSARIQVPDPAGEFVLGFSRGQTLSGTGEYLFRATPVIAEVHALEGDLRWRSRESTETALTGGDSLGWNLESDQESLIPSREASLSRLGRFAEEQSNQQAGRREAWRAFSRDLSSDERLLAYYPMDPVGEEERQLADQSGNGVDGTIVLADRSRDRWAQPFGGLDFSPMGSRVRLVVPGEYESLTLMCWVKIDSLDRWYNSLFLTDGHELHEPHWQIMNDGRLFFSVRATDQKGKADKHIAFSPPIWTPGQSGQWMHLATVYDGKAFTTTHYVNGEAVSIDPIPEELRPEKVTIGPASIGNWSEPLYRQDAEFRVRNLNGTIDEFALFSAPLDAVEIREIYEIGRP